MSTADQRRQAAWVSGCKCPDLRWDRPGRSWRCHSGSLGICISTCECGCDSAGITFKFLHKGEGILGVDVLEVLPTSLKVHAVREAVANQVRVICRYTVSNEAQSGGQRKKARHGKVWKGIQRLQCLKASRMQEDWWAKGQVVRWPGPGVLLSRNDQQRASIWSEKPGSIVMETTAVHSGT